MDTTWLAKTGQQVEGGAFAEPCYRIPALTVTASGRVLAAWDARADWRDLPGPFDVLLRTSEDHGRTWGPIRYLRRHEDMVGFGDASLLVDPASGDVLCWYVSSSGRSFFDAEAGPDGDGQRLWLARSTDDGETWTHRDLTAQLKPADVTGMFATSGNGVALASGRLLQPFVLRTVREEHWAAVASSDDGGETWELGQRVGPDSDETKVVEISGGRVLLHARATPRRRQALSQVGAACFGVPVPHEALADPGCNGGLTRWGGLLVCSLPNDPVLRRGLVVRFSADEGASWSAGVEVESGAAAYSVLAELADGALGIAWEAGDYAGLRFARIERAEVDWERIGRPDHAPTLTPVDSGGTSAKPPEVAPTPSPDS